MRIRSFRILISLYQWRLKISTTMSTSSRDPGWMNSCVKWVSNTRWWYLLRACQRYLIHSIIRLFLLRNPLFVFIVCRSCFGHVGYTQGCKTSAIQGGVLQLQRNLCQGMLWFAVIILGTMRITKDGLFWGLTKDLSQLGRDLSGAIILDNSPASYLFHNANAVPISTWFNDPHDTELSDLVDFLQDLSKVDDVTSILNTNLNNELSFPTR